MSDARTTAKRLAAEKFWFDGSAPDAVISHQNAYVSGFLDGRTVSAEQIEEGAEAIALEGHNDGCFEEVRRWEQSEEWEREAYPGEYPDMAYEDCEDARKESRAAFRAAGFRLEGDER